MLLIISKGRPQQGNRTGNNLVAYHDTGPNRIEELLA
jgi:hypothetical protein